MTTMTVQIPTGQVGRFEQMLRSMGWAFHKEEKPTRALENTRVFEAEVDELLSMFGTDQISQEEVDRECKFTYNSANSQTLHAKNVPHVRKKQYLCIWYTCYVPNVHDACTKRT